MENLTHTLVGLGVAKAGAEKLSPYATAVCLIAANVPDLDVVASFGGWCAYLQHHRGITHSIIGTLTLSSLIPAAFWLADRAVASLRHRTPQASFGGLLFASLLAGATHPLLDWTNNYGVRPFLPFSDRWYYGDLVFIADPYLWLLVGGALFLSTSRAIWQKVGWALLGASLTLLIFLVPSRSRFDLPTATRVIWVVGLLALIWARSLGIGERWGSRLARGALFGIVIYWLGLSAFHAVAYHRARSIADELAQAQGESVARLAAMPTLANPMRWQVVFETDRASYRFDLALIDGMKGDGAVRYEKPRGLAAEVLARAAIADRCVAALLGFARFPIARVVFDCPNGVEVRLADLRYAELRPEARRGFSLAVTLPCQLGSSSDRSDKASSATTSLCRR